MRLLKRAFSVLLVLSVLMASLASCSKVKDIKVTSCGVDSYSLRGLRSIDAVLAVGIDNPAFGFTVTNLSGIVKYKGEDFATYKADSLSVRKKCVQVYDVPCSATLEDGVSLMSLLAILRQGDLEGFTTDVSATVRLKSGVSKALRFRDLDLKKLME